MLRRRQTLVVLLLAPTLWQVGCTPDPGPEPVGSLRLLQANVGNTLLGCADGYLYNLCEIATEERLRDRVAALAPDVVALQEVVGATQCDGFAEEDPARTCHPAHRASEPLQARRLVGDGYSIACDGRNGFECVAVSTTWGRIEGCEPGAVCAPAETPEAPEGCDPGFTVSAVTVVPNEGAPFRLVNAHPESGFEAGCRRAQLEQVFGALAGEGPALLAGDFNLDPYQDTDEAAALWVEHVGDEERFRYHSGPAEKEPPYPTSVTVLGAFVLDHVVSDFASGACVTLGEAPGSERLDGGEGTDHRALWCEVGF